MRNDVLSSRLRQLKMLILSETESQILLQKVQDLILEVKQDPHGQDFQTKMKKELKREAKTVRKMKRNMEDMKRTIDDQSVDYNILTEKYVKLKERTYSTEIKEKDECKKCKTRSNKKVQHMEIQTEIIPTLLFQQFRQLRLQNQTLRKIIIQKQSNSQESLSEGEEIHNNSLVSDVDCFDASTSTMSDIRSNVSLQDYFEKQKDTEFLEVRPSQPVSFFKEEEKIEALEPHSESMWMRIKNICTFKFHKQ